MTVMDVDEALRRADRARGVNSEAARVLAAEVRRLREMEQRARRVEATGAGLAGWVADTAKYIRTGEA